MWPLHFPFLVLIAYTQCYVEQIFFSGPPQLWTCPLAVLYIQTGGLHVDPEDPNTRDYVKEIYEFTHYV